MLNSELTTIGKLKLVYKLSQIDVDGLFEKLLPDNVFPLVLWETAYNEHWLWSLKSNAQCYGFDIPSLPDTSPLPEKYFTYSLHSNLVRYFFDELIKKTKIDALERGINYIIECTYGDDCFPFEEDKKALFKSLRDEEIQIENRQRTSGPLVIHFLESTNYGFISNLLFDSIAVDKRLSIKFFSDYKPQKEVKGITFALVDSIIKTPEQNAPQDKLAPDVQSQKQKPLSIPRSVWEAKTKEFILAALREKGWANLEIAHVLFHKRGFTQKRTIARMLHENSNLTDFAYDKYGKKLFDHSKFLTIKDEDES